MGVSRADTSVKNWQNLPISNPKPDLHNTIAHTKFGENPLVIYSSYSPEMKIWVCLGQITPSKIDAICPLAIPNQISTIWMQIPSLVKIYWSLHKLSSGNEKQTDGRWRMDGQTSGLTDDQLETITPRHYCVAGYKNAILYFMEKKPIYFSVVWHLLFMHRPCYNHIIIHL